MTTKKFTCTNNSVASGTQQQGPPAQQGVKPTKPTGDEKSWNKDTPGLKEWIAEGEGKTWYDNLDESSTPKKSELATIVPKSGGKRKSNRNKSNRNKSNRNKSKRNKTNRNKSKRNKTKRRRQR
jgi:hypothetical protein